MVCKESYRRHRDTKLKAHRVWYLRTRYSLTPEQYQCVLDNQKGCCAFCGIQATNFPKRLAVDHDHETGKLRALVCSNCNQNKISDHTLESAIKLVKYLEASEIKV